MKKAKLFSPPKATGKKFTKKRMYDTVDWVEYRNKFLAENPLCYSCGERARVVDHIKAHKGSEDLFWNETNFLPLCKKCHDYITGKFDRCNPPKTEEKIRWIIKNRDLKGISIKVKVLSIKLKSQKNSDRNN